MAGVRTFYDEDGICHWCPKPSVGDWFGLGLCHDHLNKEEGQFLADIGIFGV